MIEQTRQSELTDETLVTRFVAGDFSAFAELLERHKERVYRTMYSFVNNTDDAQDLTQDVFVKVFQSVHTLRDRALFRAWLYQTALNLARSFLRKRKAGIWKWLPLGLGGEWENGVVLAGSATIPPDALEAEEIRSRLTRAVEELPWRYREVFVLSEYQGLDHNEVGKIVGLSPNAARQRLHVARKMMKDKLRDLMDAPNPARETR